MAAPWRFFSGSPGPAADEMALDAALLAKAKTPALRIWSLSEPAELIGVFDLPGAAGAIRRPTGGRAVKMEPGVTGWSVVVPGGEDPAATAEQVACAAAAAISGAGVRDPDIIEKDGKKIGWFGGAGVGTNVLVQGAISQPPEGFADGLKKSLAGAFSVEITDGALDPEEEELVMNPPAAPAAPPDGAIGDLPGSVVKLRATVIANEDFKKIRSANFTGTFSAYPNDLVPRLEACVAGAAINEAPDLIENFFAKESGGVAGIQAGDFFMALSLAFMKTRLTGSSAPDPNAWKKEVK